MNGNRESGAATPRSSLFRLILFGAAGLAAFAFGFLAHTPSDAGRLVQRFGYAMMMLTFAWWVGSIWQLRVPIRWHELGGWVGRNRWLIVAVALLTLVATLTLSYSYKVLYDELVLQATGWNLHFFREFGTITRGYEVEGVFRSLDVYVDKRPFFFPFLLSLIHDVTGYREANAFILNTLLLPVCLGLLYAVARTFVSRPAALAGVVCFGASPLLVQNANGSGMELLNVAMLLLTLRLAIHYLAAPEPPRLSALVLSSVLLAQTRYESALFVLPAAFVIMDGWRQQGRLILPAAALFAPVLLIPVALHNIYLSGMPALWELREDTASRFSPEFLADNLRHAMVYLFDYSGRQLNSWWLAVFGVPALAWAGCVTVRRAGHWRSGAPAPMATVLFGVIILSNLGLLMFYYWGHLDDPIVSRLVLPFNVLLGLAVAWAIGRCPPGWQERATGMTVLVSLVGYVGFGLTATEHNALRNEMATEIAWEQQWVAQRPQVSRLIITNKSPLSWLIRRVPALSINRARAVADRVKFHLDRATFREVLVFQYYRPVTPEGGFQLDPRDELSRGYQLEPVAEHRMGARLLRVSRVVSIELPAGPGTPEPPERAASSAAGVNAEDEQARVR